MSACEVSLQSKVFDFESAEGFVHSKMPEVDAYGGWTFDHWERGSANVTCPSGQECWGTNLDGNYVQCQRAYLVSPKIDLGACAGEDVQLLFEHYYDFWTDTVGGPVFYDGGLIEISPDGTTWSSASLAYPGTITINPEINSSACYEKNNFYVNGKSGFVGSSSGWVSASIVIPASMTTATFQVRFVYGTGVSFDTTSETTSMQNSAPGWYVDNLRFQ